MALTERKHCDICGTETVHLKENPAEDRTEECLPCGWYEFDSEGDNKWWKERIEELGTRKKLLEKKLTTLREIRRGKRQETLLSLYEKEMEVLDKEKQENKELQRRESIGLEQIETDNNRLEAQIQQVSKK
jgi:hypothetical protein